MSFTDRFGPSFTEVEIGGWDTWPGWSDVSDGAMG